MKKIISITLITMVFLGLTIGALGIFESTVIGISHWVLWILGTIFLLAGMSLLKTPSEPDELL